MPTTIPPNEKPASWELLDGQWPAWIGRPSHSYWYALVIPRGGLPRRHEQQLVAALHGPTLLPQLAVKIEDQPPGPGRPAREEEATQAVINQAWLVDVGGYTRYQLTKALYGRLEDHAKKQTYRDVDSGQRLLHDTGVLPWAAFADAKPPTNWWQTAEFADALNHWREQARQREHGQQVDYEGWDTQTAILKAFIADSVFDQITPGGRRGFHLAPPTAPRR